MKRFSLLAVLVVAMTGLAPQAQAAELFGGVLNTLKVEFFENLYNSDGTVDGDQVADVGDFLVGIFRVVQVDSINGQWFQSGTDQLTGVFAQEVASVGGSFPNAELSFVTPNTATINAVNFANVGGAGTFNIAMPTGAMFAVYETGGGFTQFGDAATGVAAAVNGSLYLSMNLDAAGDLSEGRLAYTLSGPDGTSFGVYSILDNNTGFTFAQVTEFGTALGDLTGQAVVTADFDTNSGSNAWLIRGDDPIRLLPQSVIPEPASMLMLGMGMGGLGLVRRRRKA
jgi:hypothetical protein